MPGLPGPLPPLGIADLSCQGFLAPFLLLVSQACPARAFWHLSSSSHSTLCTAMAFWCCSSSSHRRPCPPLAFWHPSDLVCQEERCQKAFARQIAVRDKGKTPESLGSATGSAQTCEAVSAGRDAAWRAAEHLRVTCLKHLSWHLYSCWCTKTSHSPHFLQCSSRNHQQRYQKD